MPRDDIAKTRSWAYCFGRRKPNGKLRVITDLRFLNQVFHTPPTKMATWSTLLQVLKDSKLTHATKIDIEDCYPHIALHRKLSRWIRVKISDTLAFQFLGMPFGISSGAYWATRLLKPLIAALHQQGIQAVIYIDDLLILGHNQQETEAHTRVAVQLMNSLGLRINLPKSQFKATTSIQYLGQQLDLRNRTINMPEDKRRSTLSLNQFLLHRQTGSAKDLACMAGKVLDLAKGCVNLQGLSQTMSREAQLLAHRFGWFTPKEFSETTSIGLNRVHNALLQPCPVPLQSLTPSATLTTDAPRPCGGPN
jgi:hypothetical protein